MFAVEQKSRLELPIMNKHSREIGMLDYSILPLPLLIDNPTGEFACP
jgi:hypothetical protein